MKALRITLGLLAALFCLTLLASCGGEEKEYSFASGSTVLTPGKNASGVISALGAYQNYSESGSCGGIEGKDKVYVYAGFTLETTPGKEGGSIVDIINRITVTDDSVKTPEGLAIGDAKQAVISKLGAGEESGDALIYSGKTTRLTITFRDGKITSIQYAQKA